MTTSIELIGLDGANPLAFLAALGTLRTLDRIWPDKQVRISWLPHGVWMPVLHVKGTCSEDDVVAALQDVLPGMATHPALTMLGDNLTVTSEVFREFALAAARDFLRGDDRTWGDFAVAFGCDATLGDGDKVRDTALRTMSGAGHQHFLKFMRDLARITESDHLRCALFKPWTYQDVALSMRWDPRDDRRHALRWRNPSKVKIRTVRGANRLAIEGLPMFPTAPRGPRLETTGFTGRSSRDTYWTWPIWGTPSAVNTVRSVLGLRGLQATEPDRAPLAAAGIVEIYRSQRSTIGKFRNFTPARPV